MGASFDNSFENDLKCGFPARESFREALLAGLLSLNEDELKRASSGDSEEPREEEARKAQLEDADLEMLAAAEGEESFFNPNPHLAHKPGRSGGDLWEESRR